jgi:hypothetical protein
MSYPTILNNSQVQEILRELQRVLQTAQRPPDQVILDEVELCEMLHISKRHAADLRAEGKLRYAKDGGKLYYKLSWVLEYIDKYTVKPPASFINDVRNVCRSY